MSDRTKPPEGWAIIKVLHNGETTMYRARAVGVSNEPLEWGDTTDMEKALADAWAHADRQRAIGREEGKEEWDELLHRTVEELSAIAFANLTDVVDLGDGVVAIRGEITEAGKRALSEVTETSVEMRGVTTTTLKVKMHSKVQALTLLAKITGGIVERHAGPNGRGPVVIDVEAGISQRAINKLMGAMGMPVEGEGDGKS